VRKREREKVRKRETEKERNFWTSRQVGAILKERKLVNFDFHRRKVTNVGPINANLGSFSLRTHVKVYVGGGGSGM